MEIRDIGKFLPYLESVRERTRRAIAAVPPNRLEWRHTANVFSCGDLARHIAGVERYTFAENLLGRPSRYPGCGPEPAEQDGSLSAFMERMHRETLGMLESLKPEDLTKKRLSPQGFPVTAWKLLRAMIEHEIHQRGEIYIYLALMGVPRPPLYGMTEQELRGSSVAD